MGATLDEVPGAVALEYLSDCKLTRAIQQRAVAILRSLPKRAKSVKVKVVAPSFIPAW